MADERLVVADAGGEEKRKEQVRRVELGLSYLLRSGVVLSTLVVVSGLALVFYHHPEYLGKDATMVAVTADMVIPHTVADVFGGLARGEGRSLIVLGLFVLIATPVVRVAACVLVFVHQRDRIFTVITVIVLTLLLLSFALGRAGG